jgi:hypothetical protein
MAYLFPSKAKGNAIPGAGFGPISAAQAAPFAAAKAQHYASRSGQFPARPLSANKVI